MSQTVTARRETWLTGSQMINDNVFEWSVALIVLNPDSLYYGGYFKAKMTFPKTYPYLPPGTLMTLDSAKRCG
jgi:ubiquitin-conjugating enzyme E2 R